MGNSDNGFYRFAYCGGEYRCYIADKNSDTGK
jgi:hypothetical protein